MTALAMNPEIIEDSNARIFPSKTLSRSSTVGQHDVIQVRNKANCDRRKALQGILSGIFISSAASPVHALDMDAFMNAELANDEKNCDPKRDPKCIPKLSSDEALCKYGQGGDKRSEACKRVKEGGGKIDNKPQGKSLGGAYAM
eukprot:CAMPEP_0194146518 /NCGR_PEP_ID=MMETSP0152-20130528/20754_1 /TAXON_ID=1049557 /ORGANISM="Thalassiothrix antarctica, Strain L6-D1" /LENGTH=143 /DNA_ID=CAMNT_0038847055 /DNA_START=84 /DNA_END=515 /DNA_ORIENTATION=-